MKKTTAVIALVGSFLALGLFATAHSSGYGSGYGYGSRYEYRGDYRGRYYDDRYRGDRYYDDRYRGARYYDDRYRGDRYYDDRYRGTERRPVRPSAQPPAPANSATDTAPNAATGQ